MTLPTRLLLLLVAALMVVTMALVTAGPAFAVAGDKGSSGTSASCVGATRSTAEPGDVGRVERLPSELFIAKSELARLGQPESGPRKRTTEGILSSSGTGPPGQPDPSDFGFVVEACDLSFTIP